MKESGSPFLPDQVTPLAKIMFLYMRWGILMTVKMPVLVLQVVTPCQLVDG
jgi:hypothetical protein